MSSAQTQFSSPDRVEEGKRREKGWEERLIIHLASDGSPKEKPRTEHASYFPSLFPDPEILGGSPSLMSSQVTVSDAL